MADFARWEVRAGGPDPHMVLSGHMSRGLPLEDRIWNGGCYIAVYNAPFGEQFWRHWPWQRLKAEGAELGPWMAANWHRVLTRRERRCVRRPEWMTEYLTGYAKFAQDLPSLLDRVGSQEPKIAYEEVWRAALSVPRLGRYVAIKLLEYLRRYCGAPIEMSDIRARDAWSPREMLGYLFPEEARVAEQDNSPEHLVLAEELAAEAQKRLSGDFGVDIDKFVLQVVLCDYKQSWKGKRQYPGRSVDSELEYALKVKEKWEDPETGIWVARRELFPEKHLGELNGWAGPREEAARALAAYGYTWSDLLYDFKATADFAKPVPWAQDGFLQKTPARAARVHTILKGTLYQSCNWTTFSEAECANLVAHFKLTGIVNLWHQDERLASLVPWYRWVPLPDGQGVPKAKLDVLTSEALAHLRTGGRMLVMCHAGRNRSGLVSALLIRVLNHCTGEQAMAFVRAGRARAIANPAFEEYLQQLPAPGVLF